MTLGQLLELQRHDSDADRARSRMATLPEVSEVAALESDLKRGRAALQHAADQATEARRAQERLEDQLTALEAKAATVADRLYGRAGVVSSPKELQALQADLEMINRQKADLEDQVLGAMETREAAAGLETRTADAVADIERRLADARQRLATGEAELRDALAQAEAASRDTRPAVPEAVLVLYDRIRTQQEDGVAAAPLLSGVCGGCKLRLPSAEYEAARQASGVVRCEACRRILVVV